MAPALAEAIADWQLSTGLTDEELDEPRVLSDSEMETFRLVEGDDCEGEEYLPCSFKDGLKHRVAKGEKAGMFASTEY